MSGFTGERVIPGEVDPDLLNEHLARYAFAARLARGKRVLDAGCGVGYGSARLAAHASQVVAVDNTEEAVRTAAGSYAAPNTAFLRGDCCALPFPDHTFDLVVAFEVIEHLQEWDRLVAESRRVLAEWGALVVSTPNRVYYGEQREAPNPFHVHEFDYPEFQAALAAHFPHVRIFLQNHTDSVVFAPADAAGVETCIETLAGVPEESHFFVAVCSARPLHGGPAFVYVPRTANVLREREHHIVLLDGWLGQARQSLDELHRCHQALEQEAAQDKEQAQQVIEGLEEENLRKTEWTKQTQAELERLKEILETLRAEFDERTRWAQQLEAERGELVANYQRLSEEEQKVRQDLQACVDQLRATEAELENRTGWARDLERQVGELSGRVSELTEALAAILRSPAYRIGKRLGLAPRWPPESA